MKLRIYTILIVTALFGSVKSGLGLEVHGENNEKTKAETKSQDESIVATKSEGKINKEVHENAASSSSLHDGLYKEHPSHPSVNPYGIISRHPQVPESPIDQFYIGFGGTYYRKNDSTKEDSDVQNIRFFPNKPADFNTPLDIYRQNFATHKLVGSHSHGIVDYNNHYGQELGIINTGLGHVPEHETLGPLPAFKTPGSYLNHVKGPHHHHNGLYGNHRELPQPLYGEPSKPLNPIYETQNSYGNVDPINEKLQFAKAYEQQQQLLRSKFVASLYEKAKGASPYGPVPLGRPLGLYPEELNQGNKGLGVNSLGQILDPYGNVKGQLGPKPPAVHLGLQAEKDLALAIEHGYNPLFAPVDTSKIPLTPIQPLGPLPPVDSHVRPIHPADAQGSLPPVDPHAGSIHPADFQGPELIADPAKAHLFNQFKEFLAHSMPGPYAPIPNGNHLKFLAPLKALKKPFLQAYGNFMGGFSHFNSPHYNPQHQTPVLNNNVFVNGNPESGYGNPLGVQVPHENPEGLLPPPIKPISFIQNPPVGNGYQHQQHPEPEGPYFNRHPQHSHQQLPEPEILPQFQLPPQVPHNGAPIPHELAPPPLIPYYSKSQLPKQITTITVAEDAKGTHGHGPPKYADYGPGRNEPEYGQFADGPIIKAPAGSHIAVHTTVESGYYHPHNPNHYDHQSHHQNPTHHDDGYFKRIDTAVSEAAKTTASDLVKAISGQFMSQN